MVVGEFFIPAVRKIFRDAGLFLVPSIIFSLTGGVLVFLISKEKERGLLRNFLLLTGISSAGFLIFILLHNFIYGFFSYWLGPDFWERIGLRDEPLFFLLAIIVCPTGFLIGAIGSIILFIKRKKGPNSR